LIEKTQEFGTRFLLAAALYLKGQALAAQGQTVEGYELLQYARHIAEETGARIRLFPILIALAELETARGNASEAKDLRAQARALVEYLAARTPPETRVSFLNLPLVHSLLARDD
jgi:hypothetical protein